MIESQAEQIRQLKEANAQQCEQLAGSRQRINELLTQLAWFTCQFYGCKSEKLSRLDPNQLSLFEIAAAEQEPLEEIESARIAAEQQIEERKDGQKKERSHRKLPEGLPVIEVVIESDRVDKDKYKRIGEEHTRTLNPLRSYLSLIC